MDSTTNEEEAKIRKSYKNIVEVRKRSNADGIFLAMVTCGLPESRTSIANTSKANDNILTGTGLSWWSQKKTQHHTWLP